MPFQIMKPLKAVTVERVEHNLRVSLLVDIEHSTSPGVKVFSQTVSSEINPAGMELAEVEAFIKPDLKAKALGVIQAAIAEKAKLDELAVIQSDIQTYVEAEVCIS